MTSKRPLIFITNDDGINAPGIHSLIDAVQSLGEIYVVAPDGACSGKSSAITVDSPLRQTVHPKYHGAEMHSVNGTPVDCVKLGLHTLSRRPDIVLSGINHGANSGNSVIYSGTMGAAMEACMVGIPAIGYSLLDYTWDADFTVCTPIIQDITAAILHKGLPDEICLNVNIPKGNVYGVKVVRASRGYWTEEYKEYATPGGRPFYWLTGRYNDNDALAEQTDNYWLERGYATIVPVRPDQSAADMIDTIDNLLR